MNRAIVTGFLLFLLGQGMIWYQTNSQFFNTWAKEHPLIMALAGWPISYILIVASRYVVTGFDGQLWPGRLLGFASGMIVMAILTYAHMGESVTMKTGITLLLALAITLIQVFWK
tara:strand:- start:401 stop:745 length:345 start_codon:yes stop_codon:yes gene_type:complete